MNLEINISNSEHKGRGTKGSVSLTFRAEKEIYHQETLFNGLKAGLWGGYSTPSHGYRP